MPYGTLSTGSGASGIVSTIPGIATGISTIIGFAWIPPINYPDYIIKVTRLTGAIDDVTVRILDGEISDGATEAIGSFKFTIANGDNVYTNVWSNNEVVQIFMDYSTTPTTLRFRGRIEKVTYNNNNVIITGRSEAVHFLSITVTKQFTSSEASTILKSLIDAYGDGRFTYNNVAATGTSMTVNWYQKPFLDCVTEICTSSGYDFYIDTNLDFHFFRTKSITNTTEAIVHDMNMLDPGEFGKDLSAVRNRIIVYGQDVGGQPLICTAESQESKDSIGRWQEEIINDTNITTFEQAEERANFELESKRNPPVIGDKTSVGLPTLAPGEMLRISDPDNNISPGAYRVISYKHSFKSGAQFTTTVTIETMPEDIPRIFRDRYSAEQKLQDITNPYEMRFSYNNDFDAISSGETYNNTTIEQSRLHVLSGTTGSWESATRQTSDYIRAIQLKASGDSLPGTVYKVSADGGTTYETVALNENYTIISEGRNLKVRIEINSASTNIDSVAVLYRFA